MIDKIELWDWNVANKDFWSLMAKSLHRQKVSITWAEKIDQKLASNVSNFITVVDIQQVEVFFQIELHELSMYSRVCANRPDKI